LETVGLAHNRVIFFINEIILKFITPQTQPIAFLGGWKQMGIRANTWTNVWNCIQQALAKKAEAERLLRAACVLEELEPRALMSAVTATVESPTSIELGWSKQSGASGYYVLRSSDGVHFTQIAKVTSANTTSYLDKTVASGHTYDYELQEYTGLLAGAPSTVAVATTPIIAPAALVAAATPASVKLTWLSEDASATGFEILRATNGGEFKQIALINTIKTTTYTDNTVSSDTSYTYEVKAFNVSETSIASNVVTVVTPLAAPTGVAATAESAASIQLNWTDNDSNAAGYYVLRSTDGVHYTKIAMLLSGSANSYTDYNVVSGHTYDYQIQAVAGNVTSADSNIAVANTALAKPTGFTTTVLGPSSVLLAWINNDSNTAGYAIYRSTNGGLTYTKIATITKISTTTFTDTTAVSGQTYLYYVQAIAGNSVSPASDTRTVTTTMTAPINLAAVLQGSSVKLTWTDKDSSATGYNILRSTDDTTFTQIAQVSPGSANSYVDATGAANTTYYYRVQAFDIATASASSAAVGITTPASSTQTVDITVRYGDELVVTATGADDTVSVTQSGSILAIDADGETFDDSMPAAGLFIYTRGGADTINVGASVTEAVTIDTIGISGVNHITSAGSDVSAWYNSTDIFTGTGTRHSVASFAGGVSKALGAALANPLDSGPTTVVNASLWGTGPVAGDVNQGEVGDCYFLSTLAAFADQRPAALEQSAVDLGDGTFAVQFYSNGTPVYVRVSNAFADGPFNGYEFAHPGSDGSIWAPVLEKAFAYFRTGANTYASTNSGWMGEVYSDLNVSSTTFVPTAYSEDSFYNMLSTDLADDDPVTFGTNGNAPNLVSGHAYTLVSVAIVNGQTEYVVRNPWGVSGDALENSQGYATLTFAQMKANFEAGVAAT
jgi:fibronectin type 3 domain-containing protein